MFAGRIGCMLGNVPGAKIDIGDRKGDDQKCCWLVGTRTCFITFLTKQAKLVAC